MFRLSDRRLLAAVLTAATLLVPAGAPAAALVDSGWRLRVNGSLIDVDGRADFRDSVDGRTRSSVDIGAGVSVSGEHRFNQRLGLEVGLLAGGAVDTQLRVDRVGRSLVAVDALGFAPLTAGLNVHVWPGRRGDLYLGPLLAYIQYSDLRFTSQGRRADLAIEDEVCFGALLGLDVPFGSGKWFFNANIRYLATDLRGRDDDGDRFRIDFDPLITGLGFGYRF